MALFFCLIPIPILHVMLILAFLGLIFALTALTRRYLANSYRKIHISLNIVILLTLPTLFFYFYSVVFMSMVVFMRGMATSRRIPLFTDFVNHEMRSEFRANIAPHIHQIMFDFGKDPPARWSESPKSWKRRNGAYQYTLWNEDMVMQLVREEYPWFLDTYTSYKKKIQQVDAAKYLILHARGGIYADMDIICEKPLDQLLQYEAVVATTSFGLANDFMMARKGSEFYLHAIKSLRRFKLSYFSPFLEVMFSTGPLFFSYVFAEYGWSCYGGDMVRSLHPLQYGSSTNYAITKHIEGMTWHDKDARIIWILWEMRGTFLMIAAVVAFLAGLYAWYRLKYMRKNKLL